ERAVVAVGPAGLASAGGAPACLAGTRGMQAHARKAALAAVHGIGVGDDALALAAGEALCATAEVVLAAGHAGDVAVLQAAELAVRAISVDEARHALALRIAEWREGIAGARRRARPAKVRSGQGQVVPRVARLLAVGQPRVAARGEQPEDSGREQTAEKKTSA